MKSAISQMIVVRPMESEVFELDEEALKCLICDIKGLQPPSQALKTINPFVLT